MNQPSSATLANLLHSYAADGFTPVGSTLSLECEDSDGETPLFVAIYSNSINDVAFLLKAGANISKRQFLGHYPIHAAAATGNIELVRLLIESGADPNCQTFAGKTASDHAASFRHKEIVNYLNSVGSAAKTL